MAWTLKSGRALMGIEPSNAMELRPDGYGLWNTLSEDHVYLKRRRFAPMDLTQEERREIAYAVKACWDRWAESGEP